jgi:hypothetical protein
MNLKKCPKCESTAYENLNTHSICYACNYDSVKGYIYGKSHDARGYRRMILKTEGLPLEPGEKAQVAHSISSRYLRCRKDREIANQAVLQLPPIMQTVVFLRFWSGHELSEIARLIYMDEWEVQSNLMKAFARVRDFCLEHPDFSSNRLRSSVEETLLPQAA